MSELSQTASLQTDLSCLTKASEFHAEKQNVRLFIPLFENEEDDDLISFRKLLTGSNYSTSVFLAPANDYHSTQAASMYSFNRELSYKPFQLYLMFEVFRI
ncbi:MAG: hypothetical protein JST26_12200 [Bacteroidetes bacterium]|nr:hypothetical protein [Bacteroidota bacterium]